MGMRSARIGFCSLALLLAPVPGMANQGGTGTTYGLLPSDIASAQSLSIFNTNVSAAFYNPAALAVDPRGELTGAVLDAENSLKVDASNPNYSGTVQGQPSRQLLIGMKTDAAALLKPGMVEHPIYFGFMAGVEKDGRELEAFNAQATGKGAQYFEYGRQPLFLVASVGSTLWRGIDIGAGLRVTMSNDATLHVVNNLAGKTNHETLNVQARAEFRPIFGMHVNWGDTVCSAAHCWLDGLDTAISWRNSSYTRTGVKSNAVIPGTVGYPGIPIAVSNVINGYEPATTTLGVKYDFGRVAVGVSGEYQTWSKLDTKLAHDTVTDQAGLHFKDTIVPRIGATIKLNDMFTVITGAAWVPSPLETTRSPDVNYVSADRWEAGLGLRATFKHVPLMTYPVQLNLGYQYQKLNNRTFDLSSTTNGNASTATTYATATTKGDVNVFSGSVTVKF